MSVPSPKHKFSSPLRNGSPRNRAHRSSIVSTSELADELKKAFISQTAATKRWLDEQIDVQERLHKEALDKSLAEHTAVWEAAESARQRLELQIEREKKQREDAERVKLDAEKLKVENERRKREEAAVEREKQAKLERERAAKVAQARIEQERAKEAEAAQARVLKEDAAKKAEAHRLEEVKRVSDEKAAREKAQAAQTRAQEEAKAVQESARTKPEELPDLKTVMYVNVLTASDPAQQQQQQQQQRHSERMKYMALHKKLKEMRQWTLNEAQKSNLKNQLGDMRRTIQKSLSIVNGVDKEKNKKPTIDVRTVLEQAAQMPIMLSMEDLGFGAGQYPAALLFLLNFFAKYTIHRFVDQCSRDPKAADAYGVLAAHVFANPAFHFNGKSLIDVLWAKYYKVCPVLFGLAQPAPGDLEDQTGLAAGFAAITLRNFSQSKNKNPAPNHLFWTSLGRITSTKPDRRTPAHYIVVRNMIIHSLDRFIQFHGDMAIAAMRTVFVDWTKDDTKDANVLALEATPLILKKEYGLVL